MSGNLITVRQKVADGNELVEVGYFGLKLKVKPSGWLATDADGLVNYHEAEPEPVMIGWHNLYGITRICSVDLNGLGWKKSCVPVVSIIDYCGGVIEEQKKE